ncbi:MAG TPA: DUF6526 family protein [Gemmatimonadales bacterium]|nr:DUF6526 family protein [Gemmatimonadales bacterium]
MPRPQSFENHTRYVPGYHYVLSTILTINLVWRIVVLVRTPSWGAAVELLLAGGFVLIFTYMRSFPIMVQSRLIRLEERLRLERLLPADLHSRIAEFTPAQLVGLRFASDGELPALARRVLNEGIRDRKQIKRLIKEWRTDDFRV